MAMDVLELWEILWRRMVGTREQQRSGRATVKWWPVASNSEGSPHGGQQLHVNFKDDRSFFQDWWADGKRFPKKMRLFSYG
jgi:hypothetical protein